jgi:dipeptidase E
MHSATTFKPADVNAGGSASKKNLLLLSGSRAAGGLPDGVKPGFLDFAEEWIKDFFAVAIQNKKPILFVPYARPSGMSEEEYFNFVNERTNRMGIQLQCAPAEGIIEKDLQNIGGIFVGGGHTYTLLDKLHRTGSLEIILNNVNNGLRYLGSSAGTIITCPTIKTVNDMPCPSADVINLRSLGLINIQLNCHYMDDAMHDPKHQGETRDTRLEEYCTLNPGTPALGLYEGTALRIEGCKTYLWTSQQARGNKPPVFCKNEGEEKVERNEIECNVGEPKDVSDLFEIKYKIRSCLSEGVQKRK